MSIGNMSCFDRGFNFNFRYNIHYYMYYYYSILKIRKKN